MKLKNQKNKYTVVITRYAFKKLQKLPLNVRLELNDRILELENDPRPNGYKKLTNRPGYRIRFGDYRILYLIEDNILTVTVVDTGHRKDIYE